MECESIKTPALRTTRNLSYRLDEKLVWLLVFTPSLPGAPLVLPRPPLCTPCTSGSPPFRFPSPSLSLVIIVRVSIPTVTAMAILGIRRRRRGRRRRRRRRRGRAPATAEVVDHVSLLWIPKLGSRTFASTQTFGTLAEGDLHPARAKEVVVPVINDISGSSAILGIHPILDCVGHKQTSEETQSSNHRDNVRFDTLCTRQRSTLLHVRQESLPIFFGDIVGRERVRGELTRGWELREALRQVLSVGDQTHRRELIVRHVGWGWTLPRGRRSLIPEKRCKRQPPFPSIG